jgi:hypothetical protein
MRGHAPSPTDQIRGRCLPRHRPRELAAEQPARSRYALFLPLIATWRWRLPIVFSDSDREFFAETLADGLKHFDPDEASLQKTARGDWRKVATAQTICERTTVRRCGRIGSLSV